MFRLSALSTNWTITQTSHCQIVKMKVKLIVFKKRMVSTPLLSMANLSPDSVQWWSIPLCFTVHELEIRLFFSSKDMDRFWNLSGQIVTEGLLYFQFHVWFFSPMLFHLMLVNEWSLSIFKTIGHVLVFVFFRSCHEVIMTFSYVFRITARASYGGY